jgi:S-adenosylmethionine decarboxylase
MTLQNAQYEEGGFRYWVELDGQRYAGRHLLVDMWGAQNLHRLEAVRSALLEAIQACGAHLLDLSLYQFTPNGGITSAAVLSQSHLCIHTWPEEGFVAVDLFVCGLNDPTLILPVLEAAFSPKRMEVSEHKRGLVEEN